MRLKKVAALVLAGVMMASVFTGCGLDKNETIATMEGRKVAFGVANFMARYQQASYDDMFASYVGENAWDQDLYGNGESMQETVKKSTMELIHEYYTLTDHMEEYNVSLSEDQKAKITEAAAGFISANSKAALSEMGATREVVEEVLTLYTVADLMREAMVADADTNVSDEEANMRAYSMIRIATDSHPVTGDGGQQTTVEYTEDEVSELNKKADQMLAEINADAIPEARSEENTEEQNGETEKTPFQLVAEKYDYTATVSTYAKDDTQLDVAVKTALDGMKAGQPAQLVKTDTALYIVRLDAETDADATEQNRKDIVKQRQDDLYNNILTGWQENDGWSVDDKVLGKIKFHNLFTTATESTESAADTQGVQSTQSAQ